VAPAAWADLGYCLGWQYEEPGSNTNAYGTDSGMDNRYQELQYRADDGTWHDWSGLECFDGTGGVWDARQISGNAYDLDYGISGICP
jgi:hypothetical protein